MAEVMDNAPLTTLSPLMSSGGADSAASGITVNTTDANSTDDSFAQQLQAVHKEIDQQQPDSDMALDESPDSMPVPLATDDTDLQSSGAELEVPELSLSVASTGTQPAPAAGSRMDISITDIEQQQVVPNATGAGRSTSDLVDPGSIARVAIVPDSIVPDSIASASKAPGSHASDSIGAVISPAAGGVSIDADPAPTDSAKHGLVAVVKPLANAALASEIKYDAGRSARLRALPTTAVSGSQANTINIAIAASDPAPAAGQAATSPSLAGAANGYTDASLTGAELYASRTALPAAVLHTAGTAGADAAEFAALDDGNSVRMRRDSGAFGGLATVNTGVVGTSDAPRLIAADASGQSTGIDANAIAVANADANTDTNTDATADATAEAVIAKAVTQSLRAAAEPSTGASLRIQNALDNVGNFSPENMFHATASGIVTAPTGLKPDPGPGALIFAPQNVPLATDEADEALSSNVRWMVNENIRQAVVNVTPSGMGPISIQMGIESEQMNVSIIAAQGATREALDAMLPRLREQMIAQGYENVNVNVSDSRPDQSLTGDNSRQAADSDARDDNTAESPFAEFSTSGERAMRPDRHRGLFDVYV